MARSEPVLAIAHARPKIQMLRALDAGSGSGPALYFGGTFWTAGGSPARNIAKWDGATFSSVGGGISNTMSSISSHVGALCVFDDGLGGGPALYATGLFDTAGGTN